jgi:hypothetical protein
MRIDRLAYWHDRAFKFYKRQKAEQDREAAITSAVRTLPRGARF